MPEKMKAARFHEFGSPDNITVEETEIPELNEGEVLIRVQAAGVNPVDTGIVGGYLKNAIPHDLPIIPGWDFAGVIEDRGFAARCYGVGEQVYGYARRTLVKWGTFAEYLVIPESYVARRPKNISPEEAGAIPLVGLTAYQSLYDAGNLQEGQTVLILGASGGVGTIGIQLAKARGAEVIGVASSKNHSYMKELGADKTIDYQDNDIGEVVLESHPDGVDLIFDCTDGDSLHQSLPALKENGKLVSILNRGDNLDPGIDHQYVFVEPDSSQLGHLRELTDSGDLQVHVSASYDLEDTVKALEQIASLHTKGKIVITP